MTRKPDGPGAWSWSPAVHNWACTARQTRRGGPRGSVRGGVLPAQGRRRGVCLGLEYVRLRVLESRARGSSGRRWVWKCVTVKGCTCSCEECNVVKMFWGPRSNLLCTILVDVTALAWEKVEMTDIKTRWASCHPASPEMCHASDLGTGRRNGKKEFVTAWTWMTDPDVTSFSSTGDQNREHGWKRDSWCKENFSLTFSFDYV